MRKQKIDWERSGRDEERLLWKKLGEVNLQKHLSTLFLKSIHTSLIFSNLSRRKRLHIEMENDLRNHY